MRVLSLLAAAAAMAVVSVSATPYGNPIWGVSLASRFPIFKRQNSSNPFEGKTILADPEWTAKLEATRDAFLARGDAQNADKVHVISQIGSFSWLSDIAGLDHVDKIVANVRVNKQSATSRRQASSPLVGLVLYNIPNRDCSASRRDGELQGSEGLERYKSEYIAPLVEKINAAPDVTFAIVLEPDSLANLITNLDINKCAEAAALYEDAIVHAIAKLQLDNVHLYLDAAHGGWLGEEGNLQPAAETFAHILARAGNGTRIRGFATNVGNYNAWTAALRESIYTADSRAWDEDHYIQALAPHLAAAGLPTRFIVDQGRVALPGARADWSDWCNVSPAGFGLAPGTPVSNPLVDSIVWVRAGGKSDGKCGSIAGAPEAGEWFDEYVEQLVEFADGSIGRAVG